MSSKPAKSEDVHESWITEACRHPCVSEYRYRSSNVYAGGDAGFHRPRCWIFEDSTRIHQEIQGSQPTGTLTTVERARGISYMSGSFESPKYELEVTERRYI